MTRPGASSSRRVLVAALCASIAPAEATTAIVEGDHVVFVTAPRPRHAHAKPKPAVAAAPAKRTEPQLTLPEIDPASPPTQPMYPAASRRFDESGTVVVGVMVLASGKVGGAWVEETSGYHRLDDAAVEEARRWHFIPAKIGDIPVAAKKKVVVRFGLND